ncbi:unnamed protein product [Caenorhabditis nigoni]
MSSTPHIQSIEELEKVRASLRPVAIKPTKIGVQKTDVPTEKGAVKASTSRRRMRHFVGTGYVRATVLPPITLPIPTTTTTNAPGMCPILHDLAPRKPRRLSCLGSFNEKFDLKKLIPDYPYLPDAWKFQPAAHFAIK